MEAQTQVSLLDELSQKVLDFKQGFTRLKILTDQDDQVAAEKALGIRNMKKAIEDKHALLVKPYKEITKALDARKKSLVDPLEEMLDHVRKERGLWAAKKVEDALLERKRIEAERAETLAQKHREEEAAKALGIEEDMSAALEYGRKDEELKVEAARAQKQGETKGFRMSWDFVIHTPAELPRIYLQPDESKIRAAVKAGERDIPGVQIFEKPIVQVRG